YVVDTRQSGHGHRFTIHDASRGFSKNTQGLWGDAVAKGKPIISNSYARSNPQLKGLPLDHCHIIRYMNVPIFDQDRVAVVAGMGNKAEDYTRADLRQLSLLAHDMWRLIQRKKAEQAMHQSEKRFQDLVEHSPNGIAIVMDNGLVYQNPRQLELIGDLNFLNPQEDPRFHKEDRAQVQDFYDQIKSGQRLRGNIQFRFYSGRDGDESMTWVSCLATPMEYNKENGCLLIFIDMTESKKLEHLLTIQDKMASLGHVSAGIAHEIRNPLSGINIYLGIIHKHFQNPEKATKVEAAIGEARSASQKIDAVIKRVMNFAKPTEPRFETININHPVGEAVNLTSYSLKKKGIELRKNLSRELPPCYAEPHLIEEVVLNLINTAVDAIGQGDGPGIITISTWSGVDEIVVGVADNGPGVSRDLKKKIFDPFFTTKPHSTGIGLSICHRIITDHRGTIRLGDAPGGGSCFMIQLPLAAAPGKDTPSPRTKEHHD
ncbi:MAG: ATP-binding protein, partial [Desulfobacterales bacterium]|nr:ATP-binding protein [Desulfobacterales bacterium]